MLIKNFCLSSFSPHRRIVKIRSNPINCTALATPSFPKGKVCSDFSAGIYLLRRDIAKVDILSFWVITSLNWSWQRLTGSCRSRQESDGALPSVGDSGRDRIRRTCRIQVTRRFSEIALFPFAIFVSSDTVKERDTRSNEN